jgi:hypothetical protein
MSTPLFVAALLSLAGLALGGMAGMSGAGRRDGGPAAFVDGLFLGLLPLVLVLRLAPHVIGEAGAPALLLVGVGYAVLWWSDRGAHHGARGGRVAGAIILPALLVHALTDGASLAMATSARRPLDGTLIAALAAHRLPEGLFVVATWLPRVGARGALLRLFAVGGASLVGLLLGDRLLLVLPEGAHDLIVAVGVGAMLRVVTHTHALPGTSRAARAASALGLLLGVALGVAIPSPQSLLDAARPHELAVAQSLGPLFVETAPALLIGLLALGLIHALAPARAARLLLPTSPPASPPRLALGAAAAAMAVDTLFVSLRLLGPAFTALRIAVSLSSAGALALAAVARGRPGSDEVRPPAPAPGRFRAAAHGLWRALDRVAVWYLLGLLLAAAAEAAIEPALLSRVPDALEVCLTAVLGGLFIGSPHALLPLVAVLLHKGLSSGAGIALFAGTSAGHFIGPGVTLRSVATGWALVAGLVINRVGFAPGVPHMHPLLAHQHRVVEQLAAALLAILLVANLAYAGARPFLGRLSVRRP